MTNREAIEILGQYDVSDLHFYTTDGEEIPFTEWSDAIEMAISALQEQELKQEVKNSNESSPTHKALDTVSRQAVAYLDLFTKTYCRDYSVTDDLVFRCKECEFEASGGKCLVKCMARMLCPDYKEFGCMGDL